MSELSSVSDLRQVYAEPSELSLQKELNHIDRHSREFIARPVCGAGHDRSRRLSRR